MDAKYVRILYLVFALSLVIASRFTTSLILGIAGLLLSIIMYFVGKTRYFAIGVAILSILAAIGFLPLLALLAPILMILLGEGVRVVFRKFGHDMVFFGIGSIVAIILSCSIWGRLISLFVQLLSSPSFCLEVF